MIDPKPYVVTPDATFSDIDLDAEEFHLPDGTRLTEQRAGELEAAEAEKTRRLQNLVPGRKSLSGNGTHSPVLQVRLSADLHARVQRAAAERQISASRLARAALEDFLAAGK